MILVPHQKYTRQIFATVEFNPSSTNNSNLESRDTSTHGGRNGADKSGYQRTNVDGSLQTGKIRNLQNPGRMWPYGVLGVKRCFGNGICTNTFLKTTPISWWPLLFSQVSQCTHMKEIVSRENPGKSLTSKCPKNDKNPHDCDWVLWYRYSQPKWSRMYTRIHIYINICAHLYLLKMGKPDNINMNPWAKERM